MKLIKSSSKPIDIWSKRLLFNLTTAGYSCIKTALLYIYTNTYVKNRKKTMNEQIQMNKNTIFTYDGEVIRIEQEWDLQKFSSVELNKNHIHSLADFVSSIKSSHEKLLSQDLGSLLTKLLADTEEILISAQTEVSSDSSHTSDAFLIYIKLSEICHLHGLSTNSWGEYGRYDTHNLPI